MGEFTDKATQSEIQELEGTMQNSSYANTSFLKELLNQIPSGFFGSSDPAGQADQLQANSAAAQMQNMSISPKKPEEFTKQAMEISKQIYPILKWHDDIMQSINEAIEKIPVLPKLVEQLQDQISVFVFSLLAPFVMPIISQVKTELSEGSSEVIQSSKRAQLNVFYDDNSTDPTHSMLSKDHFSNILNEPAGKVSSAVLKWVVPQLIACWDDKRIDANRTINRIINGVFHHPALRYYGDDGAVDCRRIMFGVVEQWWNQKDEREKNELRDKLSRDGVEHGRNHKPGVQDTGHGCAGGLTMAKTINSPGGGGADVLSGISSALGSGSGGLGGAGGSSSSNAVGKLASDAVGGGVLGTVVGGLVGGVGADLLGGTFGDTNTKKSEKYGQDGSYQQTYTETGWQGNTHGQAQYSQTNYPGGGQLQEYSRIEQTSSGHGSGGYSTLSYGHQTESFGVTR
jgi:hypothetical protein